jgi:Flp pilus assembly pilin Flp
MAVLLLTWHLGAELGTRCCATTAHILSTQRNLEMTALFNRLVREESGQDLIEYGLLVGIITATVVTTISFIGTKVKEYYSDLETAIKTT